MKRLLFINNGFPTSCKPNIATYAQSIRDNLEKAGGAVDTLVLDVDFSNLITKGINYLKLYIKLLTRNVNDYDVIFFNHWPYVFFPFILTKWKKQQLIIHWHGIDINTDSMVKRTLNRISYLFIPAGVIFISPSNFFKKEIIKTIGDGNKVVVSPSGGVDLDLFRFKKKASQQIIVFGFASGVGKNKGAELLLSALVMIKKEHAENYRRLKVKLINYGPFDFDYAPLLNQCNEVVELVDKMEKSKMPDFYSSIDMLLFPTQGDSLGLVALEAMAVGRPVIATNEFAAPEYVTPNISGLLVEKGSVQDLVRKINFTIENQHNIESWGKQAREIIVKKYSSDYVVGQYKKLMKN